MISGMHINCHYNDIGQKTYYRNDGMWQYYLEDYVLNTCSIVGLQVMIWLVNNYFNIVSLGLGMTL